MKRASIIDYLIIKQFTTLMYFKQILYNLAFSSQFESCLFFLTLEFSARARMICQKKNNKPNKEEQFTLNFEAHVRIIKYYS